MAQLAPIVNLSTLYISGMQISNDSGTPNTKLDIAEGQARDSRNVIDISLLAPVVLDATTTGVNGLDTGALAPSTWYFVYAIADSFLSNAPGTLLSLSATSPTLPSGYDSLRLIGFARTDGASHFLLFWGFGSGNDRSLYWDTKISVLSGGAATALTDVDCSGAAPAINGLPLHLNVSFTPNTAGDSVSLAPSNSLSASLPEISGVVAAKAQLVTTKIISQLKASKAQIQYINSAVLGATSIWVYGFDYTL